MKRVISLFLSLIMMLSMFAGLDFSAYASTYSGTCGDSVTWSLDTDTGELVISGTGAMTNYSDSPPWLDYENSIKMITIEYGVTNIGSYSFIYCNNSTKISIANSVTRIGDYAFRGCTSLTSIVIPDSVTSIGKYAFRDCTGLTSVTIGNSVTSIGNYAFDGCTSLTSVTIGNSVTSIGEWAFYGCTGLTSITLPDSVTSIGNHAFYYCTGLTSITIPDSVTSIGNSAFSDCTGLTSVAIGNSVTSIGDYAFDGCTSLTSVTIGNSVTSIDYSAFRDCTSLTSIVIPDSVTSIGNCAFYGCTGLTSVTIGNSVTSIGDYAFNGCTRLTSITIPDSVTSVGKAAFRDCTGLTSITIPDSVTSIGNYAFYNTAYYNDSSNWEDDVLYIGNHFIEAKDTITGEYAIKTGAKCIADYAFEYCTSLTSITLSDSVTSIGNYAFDGCTSLTSITLPDSVTSIGNYAFYGCTGLTELTMPAPAKIYNSEYTFGGCTNIDKITLTKGTGAMQNYSPSTGVTDTYYQYTPWYISGCENIVIEDSVSSIGNYAFYKCTSLTSITIPDSVTSISNHAFDGCTGLTSIVIPDSVTSIGYCSFDGCTSLTSIVIPDSVTSIGDSTFYNCTGLKELTMPASAKIYNSAYTFGGCTNIDKITLTRGTGTMQSYSNSNAYTDTYYQYTPWYISGCENIVIEDSVSSIGNYAFYKCTGLTELTMPASAKIYNSEYTFGGCTNIDKITLTRGTGTMQSYSNSTSYTDTYFRYTPWYKSGCESVVFEDGVTNIGSYAFYGCTGLTSIVIPDSVTSIGDDAFVGCTGLTNITIPDSVTSIGDSVFYKCTSLTSITIPDSVTSIGDSVFYKCTSLTSITIPDSVTSVGNSAFECCTGLTSIVIPDNVTSIGDYAFRDCTSLTSVTIGNSVTSIGEWAFDGCTGLTSITIPDSVTSISNHAFDGCTGLTSVTIGNSVTSIGDSVFYKCTSLTSITIPDSVTSIGNYAFEDCTGLTSVTIGNSVKSIGSGVFGGCSALINITVDSNNTYYDSRNNCNAIIKTSTDKLIAGCQNAVIPNTVTSIGSYAFDGCTGLTSIVIPDSVTSIGYCSFDGCTSLTSVTIGNSVTSIDYYAFRDCTSLTSIVIPDSVTSIGGCAFDGCTGLTSIVIPDSVTSIGYRSFDGCTGLTSIVIPDSVTSIGDSTFYNCTGLKELTMPASAKIYNSQFTFYGCTNIDKITLTVGTGEMQDYSKDTNGTDTCYKYTPWYISGCKNIVIEYGVSNIGKFAFYGCTGLLNITIPSSVTDVGYSSFNGCTGLINIAFPDSITNIDDYAFKGCTSLTNIVIPNSVSNIGNFAFYNCSSLNTITINSSNCEIYDSQDTISDTAIIKACTGSTAEEYAINYSRTFESIGHNYNGEITSPTCTTGGYTTYTCAICGDSYIGDYVSALGHSYSEYVFNNDSTDYFDGTQTSTCSRCGDQVTRNVCDETIVYSTATDINAGEEVLIPVCIKNNYGIMGWKLEFEYDENVLTPVSVEYGDVISGGIQDNIEGDAVPGNFNVYWAGSDNEYYNGVMFYVKFTVNSNAVGTTKIAVNYAQVDTFDVDFNDVILTCNDIELNVANSSYSQHAKITSSATDVVAGEDLELKLNISEITNVENLDLNVTYDSSNFSFVSATATDGVGLTTSDANETLTLNVHGISNDLNNTDFITIKFKSNEKAISGEHDFSISSTDEGVICTGCTTTVSPSSNSEVAQIYVVDVIKADYGEIVAIPVMIANNHGVMGYKISFEYDPTQLQIISTTNGDAFGGNFDDNIGTTEGKFDVLWNATDNVTVDGVLLTINAKVITEDFVNSTIKVSYSQNDTFNESWEDVVFNCSDIEFVLNNPCEHIYEEEITTPATCTADGVKTFKCSNCGDSYIEVITATGHNFGEYVSNNDATYESDGTKTATCENGCGTTDTIVDEGTKLDAIETGSCGENATYTLNLTTGELVISGSGAIDEEFFLERTEITSVVIEEGITQISSGVFMGCENITTVTVPSTVKSIEPYAFYGCSELTVITINSYDCEIYLSKNTIPDSTIIKACTGSTAQSYATKYSRTFESIGHDYSTQIVEATCTTQGYTTYTCTVCEHSYVGDYVDAFGHNFGEYISNNDATYEADGTKTATCSRCGEEDTVVDEGSMLQYEYETGSCGENSTYVLNLTTGELVISGTGAIDEEFFLERTEITSVVIEEGITQISTGVFMGCENITTVTVASTVESIDAYAFYGCDALTKITIYSTECEIYASKNTISSTATIYGFAGSTAESYALKYTRTFVALEMADVSVLEAVLESVNTLVAEDYSTESYANLTSICSAYEYLLTQSASQTAVDNAVTQILTAINELVPYLNLSVKATNGAVTVAFGETTGNTGTYSMLFGTEITLTATADEGYVFEGWYETNTKRIFSTDTTYTFPITSNTDFEAKFVKADGATLTFTNKSGQIVKIIDKTVAQWSELTTIADILPDVPYSYGYTNGRWVYDDATVLASLQSGTDVTVVPEYDESSFESPVLPMPTGDAPALDLYYSYNEEASKGTFLMASGIPEGCQIESIGVAFYYKTADEFDPTNFLLTLNNKMLTSKFTAVEESGLYAVNVGESFLSKYNWSVRGYITYYDADGNLKTAYTNQINLNAIEQIV